jgi:hypothetical protein
LDLEALKESVEILVHKVQMVSKAQLVPLAQAAKMALLAQRVSAG